jgi:hypothetical protein
MESLWLNYKQVVQFLPIVFMSGLAIKPGQKLNLSPNVTQIER